MSRLDRLKERANNLRILFQALILFVALTTSGLVTQFNEGKMSGLTFVGIAIDCILVVLLQIVLVLMIKTEKEIEKL